MLYTVDTDQMSTFPDHIDSEIQPVVESDPPESLVKNKRTVAGKKDKQKKKLNSNVEAAIGNPWTTGLFNCHEDWTNAVVTAFLPCITFGQIAEVLDEGELSSPWGSFIYLLMMPALCSQWIMGSKYRKKLRKKYDLVEAPYTDKVSHIFCLCCSLCQDYRELKNRGLDPSLG
ncbi:protein PLANT CADMIUM RESISTANCE 8 [Chenopodium quinoa]|uniref:protein PLANT CADMIUM RESISTANCE 8 n=1 Tax=Chenopodium quinoa TaxID=63459 RepID=UPI000B778FE0|nr:protein PLANT CADMIUM RESISTANCE 8 [Chenopodium quinoa]